MVLGLFLLFWVGDQWPDGKLHLIFCDVGQGDSALVVLGPFQAVIDTGAYEDRVVECLAKNIPFWDRKIEVVFLSHSDKDHVGALPGIKRRYEIGKMVEKPRAKDVIRYIGLSFDILKGKEILSGNGSSEGSESNGSSVVMRLSYGNFSALFTGDIDTDSELALVDMGVLKLTEVLKVSHHGSKYGSAKLFLEALKPKWAIISVGRKNNYGHPNGDVLIRLDAVGVKVLRTDVMGEIEIISDGKKMEVFREK